MSDSDKKWELIRLLVGFGLVSGCALLLWKNSIQPLLKKDKLDLMESSVEVREKFQEWMHAQKMQERKREILEELQRIEREEAEQNKKKRGVPVRDGSEGAAKPEPR